MDMSSGQNGRRDQVMQLLRDSGEALSIVQIATELNVHPNTARFHLQALVETDRVEQVAVDRAATGRPPLMFRAVSGMDPTGPRRYQMLAEILVHSLADDPNPRTRAVEAGRAWGQTLQGPERTQTNAYDSAAAVDHLVGVLDDLGFAPTVSATGERGAVELRHCPFLEVARHRSDVICPIHLGIMQGALDAWDAPVTVVRLDPFPQPDRCRAHLGPIKESA